ncbi:hypothetical protein B0H15DRAFT_544074 [Mycena belliarum]|uniref:Uncharacterized protein n=1 Tax=Mycena belliarum TaxID=1033014 RepID=A0AAD6XXB6_9AGAR|nr:hypothetical protein B0H15DRAFT_544074 [Mycena belliae]
MQPVHSRTASMVASDSEVTNSPPPSTDINDDYRYNPSERAVTPDLVGTSQTTDSSGTSLATSSSTSMRSHFVPIASPSSESIDDNLRRVSFDTTLASSLQKTETWRSGVSTPRLGRLRSCSEEDILGPPEQCDTDMEGPPGSQDSLNSVLSADAEMPAPSDDEPLSIRSKKRKASKELPLGTVEKAPRKSLQSTTFLAQDREDELQNVEEPISIERESLPDLSEWDNKKEQECTYAGNINIVHQLQPSSSSAIASAIPTASEPVTPSVPPAMSRSKRSAITGPPRIPRHPSAVAHQKLITRVLRGNLRDWKKLESHPSRNPIKVEGYTFPLYEATSVATSVIYWPEGKDGGLEQAAVPETTPSAGLEESRKHLPNGGAILEVRQPTASLAWLEENYDLPVIKSVRDKEEFSGPLAMLLYPEQSALTIFGPRNNDPKFVELGQKLANKSGFPVICRLSEDDPMLRFKSVAGLMNKSQPSENFFAPPEPIVVMAVQTITGDVPVNHGSVNNNSGQRRGENTSRNRDGNGEQATNPIQPSSGSGLGLGLPAVTTDDASDGPSDSDGISCNTGGGDSDATVVADNGAAKNKSNVGGGGDPDGDGDGSATDAADRWEDWVGPLHEASFSLRIQVNSEFTVPMHVDCRTQFRTYGPARMPLEPYKPLLETITPDAEAHTKLKIRFSNHVLPDRSYAFLGLEVDRPGCISGDDNLDCGFSAPTQTYKHTTTTTVQNGCTLGIGMSGTIPAPTANAAYTHNRSTASALEALDSKPMPLYKVKAGVGEEYADQDGKCLRSYNYSYTPTHNSVDPEDETSVDVGFAMGINIYQDETLPPPQVSCLNRNQIFMWIRDPSSKSKVRGLIILTANGVNNIRQNSKTRISERLNIDLETGQTTDRKTLTEKHESGSKLSMSVVPISQKTRTFKRKQTRPPSTFQKVRKHKVTRSVISLFKRPSPQVTFAARESVDRGWDASNNRWRDAIYPDLDKHFRVVKDADPTLVAYKICPH